MRLINKPVLCNYYVTYRCNAKCGFCDIWEKPSPYITLENAEQNLKALKNLGVKVIDFTGGEPLLHRNLDELLLMAKKLGFITTVTTNTLLYPKYASKLKGLIDMLHFSLDAPTREEHNASRGVNCFDHLLQSIELAIKLGEQPDILFTVTPTNIDKIETVYHEITQPNKLMLILNPVFSYNDVGSELDNRQLNTLLQWGKKSQIFLNEAFIRLRQEGGNHRANPVCKAGSSTLVISPENKLVLPCYHLGLKEIQIENNLEELYNSQSVQDEIKMEGKHAACEGCVINCYMQPSFSVEINKYFWKALPSTLKYALAKGTWKQLLPF